MKLKVGLLGIFQLIGWLFQRVILPMLGLNSRRKDGEPPLTSKQVVVKDVSVENVDNLLFYQLLGEKYFDNWLYGEPIEIDPKINDPQAIYRWLEGFNLAMVKYGRSDKQRLRNKIDILYRLSTLVRNVDGKSPSTVGDLIGKEFVKLRSIDGERFDSEVLKIKKK